MLDHLDGLLHSLLRLLHDGLEFIGLLEGVRVEGDHDVVVVDACRLLHLVKSLDLGHLLGLWDVLTGYLSHLRGNDDTCGGLRLNQLDLLDSFECFLAGERLVSFSLGCDACLRLDLSSLLGELFALLWALLQALSRLIVQLSVNFEGVKHCHRDLLPLLLHLLHHHHAGLSELLLIFGLQVDHTLSLRLILNSLENSDLQLDDDDEDFDVDVEVHHARQVRADVTDFAKLLARSLNSHHILLTEHHLLLGLFLHLLAFLAARILDRLHIFVFLEVELFVTGHDLEELDAVSDVDLVHNLGTLEHHELLGVVLARNSHIFELLLTLDLQLDLRDEGFFDLSFRERWVALLLTNNSHLLLILLEHFGDLGNLLGLPERCLEILRVQIDELGCKLSHSDQVLTVLGLSLLEAATILLHFVSLEVSDTLVQ